MVNNQLKKYEKRGVEEKNHIGKKKGLVWVCPGCLGHGSTRRVNRVFTLADLLPYSNLSSHQVPGQPIRPIRV